MTNHLSAAVRFAATLLVPIVLLGSVLPGCFLDRSPLFATREYRLQATVRNLTDGRESTLEYGNLVLDPAVVTPLRYWDVTDPTTEDSAVVWFKRYLAKRLAERAAETPVSATFSMSIGSGSSWCLVGEPLVLLEGPVANVPSNRPGDVWIGPDPVPSPYPSPVPSPLPVLVTPLPLCGAGMPAMPEECRNVPGELPSLGLGLAAIDFGDQPVGISTAPRPVELRNVGTGRLCLSLPEVLAGPDFFSDIGTCVIDSGDPDEVRAGRVLLGPGDACTLSVRFQPTGPGPKTALLPLIVNDPAFHGATPREGLDLLGNGIGGRFRPLGWSAAAMDYLEIADLNNVCVPTIDPGRWFRAFRLVNDGPGQIILTSLPSDSVWPIASGFTLVNAVPQPDPPFILGPGDFFDFAVLASGTAGPSMNFSFPGNADQNGDGVADMFTMRLFRTEPPATCP